MPVDTSRKVLYQSVAGSEIQAIGDRVKTNCAALPLPTDCGDSPSSADALRTTTDDSEMATTTLSRMSTSTLASTT